MELYILYAQALKNVRERVNDVFYSGVFNGIILR